MISAQPLVIGNRCDDTITQFLKYSGEAVQIVWLDELAAPIAIVPVANFLEIRLTENTVRIERASPIYQRIYVHKGANRDEATSTIGIFELISSWAASDVEWGQLIINRPHHGQSNSSKVLHYSELKQAGFRVPPFIVTDRVKAIVDWQERIGANSFIIKGNSGLRTVARRLSADALYNCGASLRSPNLIQAEIMGHDLRVHWVGTSYVAIRIETDSVDYRYAHSDGRPVTFVRDQLPAHIQDLCWHYVCKAQLEFAGFDFKVDKEGQYWMLEANPMPGYSFFDRRVGGAISTMLWEYLRGGISAVMGRSQSGSQLLAPDQFKIVS